MPTTLPVRSRSHDDIATMRLQDAVNDQEFLAVAALSAAGLFLQIANALLQWPDGAIALTALVSP